MLTQTVDFCKIQERIAAEAQFALARRATNPLSSVFGGITAAAAVGGAGLFGSMLLPLLGRLGLAYSAPQLISRSSPSVEVYQMVTIRDGRHIGRAENSECAAKARQRVQVRKVILPCLRRASM